VGVLDLLKAGQRDRGLTVVAATHDLNLAGRYGDEVLMLGGPAGYEHGAAENVLTPESIRRFFAVEVATGVVEGRRFLVAVGRFGR